MKERVIISILSLIMALSCGCADHSRDNHNNSFEGYWEDSIGEYDQEAEQWLDDEPIFCETPADAMIKQYYDFVCQINLNGLFEADLADLDGDGEPELIVISEVPGGKPEYGYNSDILVEVYKLIENNIVMLDSILSDTERWNDIAYIKSGEIYLSSYNGKDYICFDNYWSHQGGGTSTLFFLSLGDKNELSMEFSYKMNVYEDMYFGDEYVYENLGLSEYTSVLWYSYIEEYEFYYLSLADYWINDINVSESEYEEVAGEIEMSRDIWFCAWNWGLKYFDNFTCGKRLINDYVL